MLRILAFLTAFGMIASARAAELPSFDPAATCSNPANPLMSWIYRYLNSVPEGQRADVLATLEKIKKNCIGMEDGARGTLASEHLDGRLLTFCTAYAVYHQNGYLGMEQCVLQTKSDEQLAQLEDAWGPTNNYCVKAFPEGQSSQDEFQQCMDAEHIARLEFEVRGVPYPAPAFNACLNKAQAAGKSFVMLRDCLTDAANK